MRFAPARLCGGLAYPAPLRRRIGRPAAQRCLAWRSWPTSQALPPLTQFGSLLEVLGRTDRGNFNLVTVTLIFLSIRKIVFRIWSRF